MPGAFRRLVDGNSLTINGHQWQILIGRGHSPEHACLYSSTLNTLISGDQVIPRITSNISVSGSEPEGNPLRDWFRSLERFLELLPADALVLPAHNTPFYGLHERLRYLLQRGQLARTLDESGCYRYRSVDDTLPLRLRQRHHTPESEGPFEV